MNDKQKIQLQQMIKDNDVEDHTEEIRKIKHSVLIRKDLKMMEMLKTKYAEIRKHDDKKFSELCMVQCSFLYEHYTDIYNKLKSDEVNLGIFAQFLHVLERIENEELDQHEGSFEIGKLLKKIYVDTALLKADTIGGETVGDGVGSVKKPININWKEFKTMSQCNK